jgi:hypothetical protein
MSKEFIGSKVFISTRPASLFYLRAPEGGETSVNWTEKNKELIVGVDEAESAMSYSNIVIKTVADDIFKTALEVDLSDVDPDDGDLTIKLRKVQICDDNGKNGYVYMFCSEAFGGDDGFIPPSGLG